MKVIRLFLLLEKGDNIHTRTQNAHAHSQNTHKLKWGSCTFTRERAEVSVRHDGHTYFVCAGACVCTCSCV